METLRFEELGICPEIQKAVKHMGFEEFLRFRVKPSRL